MKLTVLILSIGILFSVTACLANPNDPDLKLVRKGLIKALESPHITDSLYNSLDKLTNKTPLTVAYMGTLDALKAKHAWNPYSKIRYLNLSDKLLKNAVTADPHNIEIRFMRFSIQHNVPHFLGYAKDLVADKEEMIRQLNQKNYGSADKVLTETIIKFLITSRRCTIKENNDLHKQLAALK